ncbi:TerB family tellurite resistance protein [Streptomyces sp. NPDC003444]|uniref:TerB family tellurite resistance protein n=1 Tax=unclassified Streptomyces TaxID=2593676 RepID=UPI000EF77044|nr:MULTISPECIES: TerB family tellurite resistance protein [unclassified Streptomyces]MZE49920.1 TerB family tellurite resistance protein [Streptomyces sp. SID5770]
MRSARNSRGGKTGICGVRTSWNTVGDGEFFCEECGGDRNYRRRTGRRRFAVLGVPVLPRGCTGPVVECAACHTHFGTEVLDRPTTSRFSAMLRDGVHTVALAVLAAGGTGSRAVLDRAVSAVRSAGFAECTAVQLVDLVEALEADTGRFMPEVNPEGTLLAIEIHEALEPLAPHLAPSGRESILVQAARIALADGAYSPAEMEVLGTVGNALSLPPDDTVRLLASARTVS